MKRRALDLFCGAGGATRGLQLAGFHVTGVDIRPQPHYCGDAFLQADALEAARHLLFHRDVFDLVWASPPCQRYTCLRSVFDSSRYPDLVDAVRERLQIWAGDWIIENVPGAPLRVDALLCGTSFGLRTYRHRIFECSFPVLSPVHSPHSRKTNAHNTNRKAQFLAGSFASVTGDIGSYCGPEAMGIDWMTGKELSQAIPPAYSRYLGEAFLATRQQEVA